MSVPLPSPASTLHFGDRTKHVSSAYGYRNTMDQVDLPMDVFLLDVLLLDHLPKPGLGRYYDHSRFRGTNVPSQPLLASPSSSLSTPSMDNATGNEPSVIHHDTNKDSSAVQLHTQLSTTSQVEGCTAVLFCCLQDGTSVTLKVKKFRPYFSVECPDHWTSVQFDIMAQTIEKQLNLLRGSVCWNQQSMAHYYEYKPSDADVTQPKQFNVVHVSFPDITSMKDAQRKLPWCLKYIPALRNDWERISVYEGRNVEPENKFLEALGAVPAGWLRVQQCRIPEQYHSHSSIEVECDMQDLMALSTKDEIPALIIASIDIECVSEDGTLPRPFRDGDEIICINTTVARFGEWKFQRFCHYVGACDLPDPEDDGSVVQLFCFNTAAECMEHWRDFIVHDIAWQIRVGYNIFRFDDEYMGIRVARSNSRDMTTFGMKGVERRMYPGLSFWRNECGIVVPESRFFRMSSLDHLVTPLFQTSLSTAAMGDNDYNLFTIPGVVSIDLLPYIKNKFSKLEYYNLDYVSEQLIGMHKISMSPHEIFDNHRGGPAMRKKIVQYCARDCDLPMIMLNKLQIITDLVEMARITNTTIDQLMTAGQTVKSWNQIVREAHAAGHIMNTPVVKKDPVVDEVMSGTNKNNTADASGSKRKRADDVGYQGAKVFDPIIGYFVFFLLVLDFASLYPSIMQRKNLCYSTLVRDMVDVARLVAAEVPIEKIPSGDGVTTHHFVQFWQGIVPKILEKLKIKRKQVKAEMAKWPEDSTEYKILNARQNAIKITMNSLYGIFGTRKGKLSCVPIAESTTRVGRDMILTTKDLIEIEYAEYGAVVIYGDTDSVMILLTKMVPCYENISKALELGVQMARRVTQYFRSLPERWASAVELTFEKMYWPYYIQQKKHYAGQMWTLDGFKKTGSADKIDTKGVADKRRDKFPALRRTMKAIWEQLLEKRSIAGAAQVIMDFLQQIVEDKLPLEDYILTGELKKDYAQKPAHVMANEKRRQREAGSEYKPGMRAPYIFVLDTTLRQQPAGVSERADDPDWVRAHPNQYKIDRMHYLHLCDTSFEHVLGICFENGSKILQDARRTLQNRITGQTCLNAFFAEDTDPMASLQKMFADSVVKTPTVPVPGSLDPASLLTYSSQSCMVDESGTKKQHSGGLENKCVDVDALNIDDDDDGDATIGQSKKRKYDQLTSSTSGDVPLSNNQQNLRKRKFDQLTSDSDTSMQSTNATSNSTGNEATNIVSIQGMTRRCDLKIRDHSRAPTVTPIATSSTTSSSSSLASLFEPVGSVDTTPFVGNGNDGGRALTQLQQQPRPQTSNTTKTIQTVPGKKKTSKQTGAPDPRQQSLFSFFE